MTAYVCAPSDSPPRGDKPFVNRHHAIEVRDQFLSREPGDRRELWPIPFRDHEEISVADPNKRCYDDERTILIPSHCVARLSHHDEARHLKL